MRRFIQTLPLVFVSLSAAPPLWAGPCVEASAKPTCSAYTLTEASLTAPLVGARLHRGLQFGTAIGGLYRIDPRWALGPIASVGYESEVGATAGGGLRLHRHLDGGMAASMTAGFAVLSWDRGGEHPTGATIEGGFSPVPWFTVAGRVDLIHASDRWAPSLHGTLRLGSYAGLAVGAAGLLLMLTLDDIAFTT